MVSEPWDVVVVPFPFSERGGHRRRPALVISSAGFNAAGHSVLTMITTSSRNPWPGDAPLADYGRAGLKVACRVRLKLFTLDNRLIVRRIGTLSAGDRAAVIGSLREHVNLAGD